MKAHFLMLTAAIVLGAATAANAAETVTMNAIDANGVGKEIGTLSPSDSNEGLRISPQLNLRGCPRVSTAFMFT